MMTPSECSERLERTVRHDHHLPSNLLSHPFFDLGQPLAVSTRTAACYANTLKAPHQGRFTRGASGMARLHALVRQLCHYASKASVNIKR